MLVYLKTHKWQNQKAFTELKPFFKSWTFFLYISVDITLCSILIRFKFFWNSKNNVIKCYQYWNTIRIPLTDNCPMWFRNTRYSTGKDTLAAVKNIACGQYVPDKDRMLPSDRALLHLPWPLSRVVWRNLKERDWWDGGPLGSSASWYLE